MGDMGDVFNDWKAAKRALRDMYGINCPQCNVKQPKRIPTILLPSQRCKVDGYRDPRPKLTLKQEKEAYSQVGFTCEEPSK